MTRNKRIPFVVGYDESRGNDADDDDGGGTHLFGQQAIRTVFEKALVPSVCQRSEIGIADSIAHRVHRKRQRVYRETGRDK